MLDPDAPADSMIPDVWSMWRSWAWPHPEFGDIVAGAFTPVLAKHSSEASHRAESVMMGARGPKSPALLRERQPRYS